MCEDDIYDSIVSSNREFNDLTISYREGCHNLVNPERIIRVVEKFGKRITKFKIWCSVQSNLDKLG